ncbi:thiamine pyrophosphokinase [Saccharomonospora sp. CUA-673]|uniref:putative cytokinetic ring protein SteA n=1 Tax=Saccharomonospora sp. CUA-673 TaxID=1904969 RepID=UPI00095F1FFD|nr:putative cytokinetic ring protein SteA [Saccharomonospora sp. CUA-673]OLT47543.1 thiamine pyrophosphokinase [Saccharomonospora sp. CUA-673]
MKLSGMLTRAKEPLPGISGVARVDRRTRELLRRVGSGDIVVLDEVDIDRATADTLVQAEVAAVVNAAPSISGRFPNLGPEILVEAGIPLVDNVGADVVHRVKDGAKVRLDGGTLYSGDKQLASGTVQTAESIADSMIEAKAGMSTQLEAFSANTIEFLRRERALILDGVGVPDLRISLKDRNVLVVAPGNEHAEDLKTLKKFINEHRPALIGVDSAADTLRSMGYTPDIVVGDPNSIEAQTLKECHEVVVPAQPDGYAPGVERIQDLGIGAVTFPASGNAEDLALLLADTHEASLVVTVGFQATLREFLDHGRSGSNPSTFLTRLKLGTKLVDGKAVATLHRNRVSMAAVVLLVLAALVVVAAALLVSDVGTVYVDWLRDTWNSFVTWLRGLF